MGYTHTTRTRTHTTHSSTHTGGRLVVRDTLSHLIALLQALVELVYAVVRLAHVGSRSPVEGRKRR